MLGRRMTQRLDQLMVLAIVFILVASTVVRAQDTSGLSGQVTDPTGKVIPGATVTLTNPATGATRSVKTSDDGNYGFNQVPPGTYNVTWTYSLALVVPPIATYHFTIEVPTNVPLFDARALAAMALALAAVGGWMLRR